MCIDPYGATGIGSFAPRKCKDNNFAVVEFELDPSKGVSVNDERSLRSSSSRLFSLGRVRPDVILSTTMKSNAMATLVTDKEHSISAVAVQQASKSYFTATRSPYTLCLSVGDNPQRSKFVLYLHKLEGFSLEQRKPLAVYPAFMVLLDSLICPALIIRLTVIASGIISEAVKRFEMRSKFQLEHLIVGRDAGKFVKGLLNPLVLRSIAIRVLSEITGTDAQIPPFPDLRKLQFYWSQSLSIPPVGFEIMDMMYACVNSRIRRSNATGVVPFNMIITASDEQARKMLNHPLLRDLRSKGATVDIVAI
ncbi:hypothetical protein F5876DRAFT_68561 [Lentinula aff. lateritia]|uniref:Uncharacterized protein n=1 Tax=Lentinula aff. lateritia TaxID=2804960 RepID=A0ACC1TQF6_9AGAR|nr:hypothetical protein F5876DRAFT_68561 [Lentinula aff. lateritia]